MNKLTVVDVQAFSNHPRLLTRATGGARRWTMDELKLFPMSLEAHRLHPQYWFSNASDIVEIWGHLLALIRAQTKIIGWHVTCAHTIVKCVIVTKSDAESWLFREIPGRRPRYPDLPKDIMDKIKNLMKEFNLRERVPSEQVLEMKRQLMGLGKADKEGL